MSKAKVFKFLAMTALFVITVTISIFADPVEAGFAGLGGGNQNGEYTYPYFITIAGGPQIPMMCDDFYHQSNVGDTWQANITALTTGDLSNTRFNDLIEYEEAGYLLMHVNDGDQAEWGNINFAIWKIFNPSVGTGETPPGTMGPEYWYNLAQTTDLLQVDFSNLRILAPLNPYGESGDQEFLYLTPEPGTLALIGGALIGLFSQRKRLV